MCKHHIHIYKGTTSKDVTDRYCNIPGNTIWTEYTNYWACCKCGALQVTSFVSSYGGKTTIKAVL